MLLINGGEKMDGARRCARRPYEAGVEPRRPTGRGVGEGTAITAMAVPLVGTPKLSDTYSLKKAKRRKKK